ncbi:MAG TPA: response regulator transcription factor [Casimicrobiaceae bacterium]|nr:response regulator transcription factor [Casimicrobiaceae bacterium]
MRILVAEDDAMLGDAIAKHLTRAGHAVDWVRDGAVADRALRTQDFVLIVLDLGLPGMPGRELLSRLRGRASSAPVLIITAADAISDRVAGLDAGADDYLVKPFALAELEARARALIRRSHGRDRNVLAHGTLTFDTAARSASVDGDMLDLSARELAVLELLLLRSGRVVAKEQFVEHMCGWDQDVTENAIEVYVHRLRRKLEPVGIHVQTVRGLGYYIARP